MCDVMEKAVAEERINSIKILVSSFRKHSFSDEEIIKELMESYGLSRDEAEAPFRTLFSCEKKSYAVIVYSTIMVE